MRKISIREFRSSMAAQFEDLPFAVTKNGVVIAEVVMRRGGVELGRAESKRITDKAEKVAGHAEWVAGEGVKKEKISSIRAQVNRIVERPFRPYSKTTQAGEGRKGSK